MSELLDNLKNRVEFIEFTLDDAYKAYCSTHEEIMGAYKELVLLACEQASDEYRAACDAASEAANVKTEIENYLKDKGNELLPSNIANQ